MTPSRAAIARPGQVISRQEQSPEDITSLGIEGDGCREVHYETVSKQTTRYLIPVADLPLSRASRSSIS
jgi:hypothetical protein